MRLNNGKSISRTDMAKREMSFGIEKKRAWRMVKLNFKYVKKYQEKLRNNKL